jgi:CRISPR-associated protein Csd1
MLLQRLTEYADRELSLPPAMYQEQPIRYFIDLDHDGKWLGISDTSDPGSRATERGVRRLAPHVKRSSGVRPKLLADNGEYALGIVGEGSKADRVTEQHASFVALVDRASTLCGAAELRAVSRFLTNLRRDDLPLPEDFDARATLTFRVGGVLPIDLPKVQASWATLAGERSSDAPEMECLICGESRPALDRHPLKIKGILAGQSAGTDLISANAAAFESYGLKHSLIAPTCQQCAEKYANALNDLLAGGETHVRAAGVEYVFWPAEPVGFSAARFLSNPTADDVRELYRAVQTGRSAATELDAVRYFGLALGASGSRTAVLSWIDVSVAEAQRQLWRWFRRQELADLNGDEWRPLGAWQLANATVLSGGRESPAPSIPTALLRTALTGAPLPMDVLARAVQRNRAEQGVTRPRAALIKLVLCSQMDISEEEAAGMVELNPERNDPAYLCGRLMAVLDAVQRRALNNPNATIVDRYYGAASSAPASVFGTLLHGAQPHLAKMRKDPRSKAASAALNRRLEEVLAGLDQFPTTLTLQEQGLFALGFYHQRAADRKAAREHRDLQLLAPDEESADEA